MTCTLLDAVCPEESARKQQVSPLLHQVITAGVPPRGAIATHSEKLMPRLESEDFCCLAFKRFVKQFVF